MPPRVASAHVQRLAQQLLALPKAELEQLRKVWPLADFLMEDMTGGLQEKMYEMYETNKKEGIINKCNISQMKSFRV